MATSYIDNMQINSIPEITRRQLKKADRLIPVPFEIKLDDNKSVLLCEQVVRIIPGKRLVVFGQWENKPVVAKLFYEWRKAKKHAQRDVTGIEALLAVNVPTPELLYRGMDRTKRIHVLIFERIFDSYTLDTLWNDKSSVEELLPLMRAVIIELATQHVLGIIQTDLHLKNFLVTSKMIYTLDGGSINTVDMPLSKKESLEHLALFFSQLGVGTEKLQKKLFDFYSQSRGWIVKPSDVEFLQYMIVKNIKQRWLKYQKKIMRNCTTFSRKVTMSTLTLFDREYESPLFKQLLQDPDSFFVKSDTVILKNGRSSTVAKIKMEDRSLVIKRYNIKNTLHWLRRCFRRTRAEKSWELAHHLRLMGVATAKPVAFIEKRFLGLRRKSYFIMEYVSGKNIGEFLFEHQQDEETYIPIAKRMVHLIHQLSQLKMTHGDLKMTNIIIHHDCPVLIDLDGMKEHLNSFTYQYALKIEKQRFMKNWESYPSIKQLFATLLL